MSYVLYRALFSLEDDAEVGYFLKTVIIVFCTFSIFLVIF
jgi:hypothetical protein